MLIDMNREIRFARTFWVRDQVLVEAELVGETLDQAEFDNCCRAAATVTDHFGPLIVGKCGGKTAFADEKTGETKAEDTAFTELYL